MRCEAEVPSTSPVTRTSVLRPTPPKQGSEIPGHREDVCPWEGKRYGSSKLLSKAILTGLFSLLMVLAEGEGDPRKGLLT